MKTLAEELHCSNKRCQAVYPYDDQLYGSYCPTCWRGQLLVPSVRHRGHKVSSEDSEGPASVRSAADLLMDRHTKKRLPAALCEVVDDPRAMGPDVLRVGLEGPPSGGKTHLALCTVRDLCSMGKKVLMVSAEMGTGAKLADRLAQLEGPWSGLDVTDSTNPYQIAQSAEGYDWVIGDSMNMIDISPSWWFKNIPCSCLLIFQVTKAGAYRGDQAWQHLSDLWVRCYKEGDEYLRDITKCWLVTEEEK